MSTVFEDYQWTVTALIGVAISLLGNWIALSKTTAKTESSG
jgi:hypothetical protein